MELELFVDVQPGTAPGTGHHPPDSAEDFRGVIKVWGLLVIRRRATPRKTDELPAPQPPRRLCVRCSSVPGKEDCEDASS